jgi:hypothetical protein
MDNDDALLTVAEIAERLRLDTDTVRRLFRNEPGIVIICSPVPRRRTYRTLRIPPAVVLRVLTLLTLDFHWRLEDLNQPILTVEDIAQTLRVAPNSARRLLARTAGVLVIRFPTPGKRTYRTLRIPQRALTATIARLTLLPDPELPDLKVAETLRTASPDSWSHTRNESVGETQNS